MTELGFIDKFIEDKKDFFINISSKIWEFAELPYEEVKSSKLLMKVLEDEGFEVIEGVAEIPTAFTASFGEGKPIFGFLGEYDALDTLSQEPSCTVKKPIIEGDPGHGCGHNLLGVGSLAATLAVKKYLIEKNLL